MGSRLALCSTRADLPTTADGLDASSTACPATASDKRDRRRRRPPGAPLGVRVEGNVSPAITGNTEKLVFAIDGALAEARTAAFFANDQAPLTAARSRTSRSRP